MISKCRCCSCFCLSMSKRVVVCVCHSFISLLYVIILGFYKIHLFLFDHGTFKCCEMTRNETRAPEWCHDSFRTLWK